jgi:glycerol kinase
MASDYIIAIDQGTTGTTMLLLDSQANIIHKFYQSIDQSYPRPGWVEHNAEQIWDTVCNGLHEITNLPGLNSAAIRTIGITNQRETIVIWNRRSGKPVCPAIVWQCRRTADRCQELIKAGWNDEIAAKTGLRLDPYFSATKIEWLLQTQPGLAKLAQDGALACGTIDSWLIWKLTGGKAHCTDPSNACRTMLYNIHDHIWDPDLLQRFAIPKVLLPEVKPSDAFFGETLPALTGRSIPITGVLGDQQAALFGQGCLEAGMIKNTYGTGCFLLMNTGNQAFQPQNGLLTSIAWQFQGKTDYVLEGSVFNAGTVVQWLRDELGILKNAAESENLAKSVPDTSGVYLVPAFTGLGAPHWDPYARGIICGLTRGAGKAHIVRAALEGIAFQVQEVITHMCQIFNTKPEVLRVDGGAAANNFLMQFQADISHILIQRNRSIELTGIGAAFMAGLTAGIWKDPIELKNLVGLERTFEPQMSAPQRQELLNGWIKAVSCTKGWAKE